MREKLSELMRSLLEFWQDPQPGLFTWKDSETLRLQRVFDLLWRLGFRPLDSMKFPEYHALERCYLELADDFEGDLHIELAIGGV